MKALDLFSCIGGHSIGLAAAGIETIAFCEKDEWRREILAMHFPGIDIYDDVDSTPALPADIYVGGPPCQGTSVAAAIHGTRDGRTLWPNMLRLVSEGAPAWVVVEPRDLRVGHGITSETSERVRRIKAIGDSNPPVMMEAVGRAIVAATLSVTSKDCGGDNG
jgi:site-specific DNA-cytosine methylase